MAKTFVYSSKRGTVLWNSTGSGYRANGYQEARFGYESSSNDTTYTLSINGGQRLTYATATYIYLVGSWTFTITGTGQTAKTITRTSDQTTNIRVGSASPGKVYTEISDFTWTWNKTHATQSITITAYFNSSYKASKTFTIPAKTSYTISYDNNAGTVPGATITNIPRNQTKWHGESLNLQSTKPKCVDSTTGYEYVFKGWNTASNGTGTMYQPDQAYTGNPSGGLKLYAIWEKRYYAPTIQNLTFERCLQNGDPEDEGTYAKVTFDCVINRWKHSGNTTLSTASVNIGSHTATPTITYSTDGYDTVCTCSAIVGDGSFSADATYTGSISVTDSSTGETLSTATANIVLNSAKFAIDMSANGRSIGIFKPASDTEDYLFDVGGKIQTDDQILVKTNMDSTTHPSSALYPKLIEVVDANGLSIGCVEGTLLTDGKNGVSLTAKKMVSDTAKYNYLRLLVDDSGNPVVQVRDAAAWRTGLGLGGLATKSSVTPTTVAKTFSKVHSSAQASGNVFTVSIPCTADTGYKPIAVTGVYCNGTGTGAVYLRGFNVNGYNAGPTEFTVDTYWRASGSISAKAMTAYVEILTMKTSLS